MATVQNDNGSTTNTVRYGSDNVNAKQAGNDESARAFAERGVVERHGEPIRQNPQFNAMVETEMKQVEDNRKASEPWV